MALRPLALAVLLAVLFAAAAAPRRAEALDPNTFAVVSADGDCLRVRSAPGLAGSILDCVADGSIVTVLDGRQQADGLSWQYVTAGKNTGWVAEQYLRPLASSGAPPPAPAPPPSTTATISGSLPAQGGLALVVWSGGSADLLASAAAARGCNMASAAYLLADSTWARYIVGAPSAVNRDWLARFPAGLPAGSPLVLRCAAGTVVSPPPTPAPPSIPGSGGGYTAALPPGTPSTPPGPAGNQ